jgi:hypothetical protein
MDDDGLFNETLSDKAIRFQNGMVASATGGSFDGGDPSLSNSVSPR